MQNNTLEYVLRLGDSSIIIGHRLSQLCGHGPVLEEDIATTNIALDFIGLGTNLLDYAADLQGNGATADTLAFMRGERHYKNLLITELPNGDFAFTTVRQFLFDVYQLYLYEGLTRSNDERLRNIALKSYKEIQYHVRHTAAWMLRLGDGTTESHERMQTALNELWAYTGEFFAADAVDSELLTNGVAPDLSAVHSKWLTHVSDIITQATLTLPTSTFAQSGSREGKHSEHLGFLLAEMQYLPRMYPDAKW
ncbi:MAG: phenylacetate-CoA oxygenase subunit PaaC [Bacteroidia bacterium]|nr:phenylacetate-CoA oxygenase subunit PaaC [Bacteroidia bacterium]